MSAAMLKLLMTNSFERVVFWNYELRWGRRGLKNKIRVGVLDSLPPRRHSYLTANQSKKTSADSIEGGSILNPRPLKPPACF